MVWFEVFARHETDTSSHRFSWEEICLLVSLLVDDATNCRMASLCCVSTDLASLISGRGATLLGSVLTSSADALLRVGLPAARIFMVTRL